MNVYRLQTPWTEIDETMRQAGGSQHRFAGFGVDHLIAHEEPCAALLYDEDLVIGVDMQLRSDAGLVIAIVSTVTCAPSVSPLTEPR